MEVKTYFCSACTTASIAALGTSANNARDAMMVFCKESGLVGGASRYRYGLEDRDYGKLESFYVFTAGPEESGYGHSKAWVKYGTEFAAYIQEQGLGVVVTPGKTLNFKYHPNTTCQTWLWMPDYHAMIAWWERENGIEQKEKPKEEVPSVEGFKNIPGRWDKAYGIANMKDYACPHCKKEHDYGANVWYASHSGYWYCEAVGKANSTIDPGVANSRSVVDNNKRDKGEPEPEIEPKETAA